MIKLLISLTFALTLALTVWMYSKWPPSCWKVIGLWLKNHWKATSNEVSCVALQLSTTLSPTVTSTLLGLSSTRMASGSTKLLHCHLRLTQSYCHEAEFGCDITARAIIRTQPQLGQRHSPSSGKYPAWLCSRLCTVHLWDRSLYAVMCVLVIWFLNVRALGSRLSKRNKFPSTQAKVGGKNDIGVCLLVANLC